MSAEWGTWGPWSSWSTVCGGVRVRMRSCDSPAPGVECIEEWEEEKDYHTCPPLIPQKKDIFSKLLSMISEAYKNWL